MRSNCTGREFLKYARETLEEERYRAAFYLSCVAEFEFAKVGDSDGLLEAMQFTGLARAHFINEIGVEAYKRGFNPDPKFMETLIKGFCNYVFRQEFSELIEEFTPNKPSEDLLSLIEETLMEIPKIK